MKNTVPELALGEYAVKRVKKKPPAQESAERSSKADEQSEKESKEAKKSLNKLEKVVDEAQDCLAKATSVFPFNLFPDTITIDKHKLTIFYRTFIGVGHTVSVPIEMIKNIEANAGPFFGSLVVTSESFINNTQSIDYLWKSDALKVQRMVQGLMVCSQEGIDVSKIPADELVERLEELGKGDPANSPPAA